MAIEPHPTVFIISKRDALLALALEEDLVSPLAGEACEFLVGPGLCSRGVPAVGVATKISTAWGKCVALSQKLWEIQCA